MVSMVESLHTGMLPNMHHALESRMVESISPFMISMVDSFHTGMLPNINKEWLS
jgi:hypothetical protein